MLRFRVRVPGAVHYSHIFCLHRKGRGIVTLSGQLFLSQRIQFPHESSTHLDTRQNTTNICTCLESVHMELSYHTAPHNTQSWVTRDRWSSLSWNHRLTVMSNNFCCMGNHDWTRYSIWFYIQLWTWIRVVWHHNIILATTFSALGWAEQASALFY